VHDAFERLFLFTEVERPLLVVPDGRILEFFVNLL